ncbi:MAG: hypothetical protein JWQ40_519 [Segetibacter sp.]|nr:hypothetical protein [Segetibacter sp.]
MSSELRQNQVKIINQLFELEKKIAGKEELLSLLRNIERIKNTFEEMGLQVLNPLGEPYSETRTDCMASISGDSIEDLYISNVIKPIVYELENGSRQLLQKGVVIAETKK